MKALVIAPQPFFTPRGTPMSVYYRSLVMAEQGVAIDLLTYGEGQDVRIPNLRIVRIPRFAWLGHVKTGPSLLKIFLDLFMALWTTGLLIRRRYDFVHVHEEAVFIAIVLKPIFRFKLIYDMHSSLPEQLRNFGWSKSNLLHRLMSRAEDAALRQSDALITICPALADYATSRIDDAGKHLLIENSIYSPVELDSPIEAGAGTIDVDRVFREIGVGETVPSFLYAGTLESYQGIDLLLEGMALVLNERPDARLIVVGGTPDQVAHFQGEARDLGISDDCFFFSRVPQETAKAFMSRGTVIVSPRSQGMNTPLKIYELIDSGKPLVATRIPSHTQVLNDEVAFLADASPEGFSEQMLAAISNPESVRRKTQAARRLYAERYAPAIYTEKIVKLLDLVS